MSEEQTAPAAEEAAPDLNMNDLAAMRNLIDVVTQRGAFKAEELSVVGALYEKLDKFVKAATPKEEATEEVAETA